MATLDQSQSDLANAVLLRSSLRAIALLLT
jgi:hypothetical protein